MKKVLIILLTAVCLFCSACGGGADTEPETTPETTSAETSAIEALSEEEKLLFDTLRAMSIVDHSPQLRLLEVVDYCAMFGPSTVAVRLQEENYGGETWYKVCIKGGEPLEEYKDYAEMWKEVIEAAIILGEDTTDFELFLMDYECLAGYSVQIGDEYEPIGLHQDVFFDVEKINRALEEFWTD